MLPPHLRPRVTHIEPPTEDSGEWRERGVSHWHLRIDEFGMFDRQRWDDERVAWARTRPTHGVAWSPAEVVAWVSVQAPRDAYGDRLVFWFAMRGEDCLGLRQVGAERIAHVSAYAVRAGSGCGCEHGA